MTLTVISNGTLGKDDEAKIRQIFEQSRCPNETLKNTLGATYDPDKREIIIGNPKEPLQLTVLFNVKDYD